MKVIKVLAVISTPIWGILRFMSEMSALGQIENDLIAQMKSREITQKGMNKISIDIF